MGEWSPLHGLSLGPQWTSRITALSIWRCYAMWTSGTSHTRRCSSCGAITVSSALDCWCAAFIVEFGSCFSIYFLLMVVFFATVLCVVFHILWCALWPHTGLFAGWLVYICENRWALERAYPSSSSFMPPIPASICLCGGMEGVICVADAGERHWHFFEWSCSGSLLAVRSMFWSFSVQTGIGDACEQGPWLQNSSQALCSRSYMCSLLSRFS